ncbi:MAG: hypothetical protein WCA79_09560 [Anaerolineales bacterium]
MKRKNLLIVGLLFATVLFTSCGGPTATPVATSVPATASPASTNTLTVPATSTSTSVPTATVASTATFVPATTSTLAPSSFNCPAGTYYGAGTNQCIAVQIPTLKPCKLTANLCAHSSGKQHLTFYPATCSCE